MVSHQQESIQHLIERYEKAPDSRVFAPLADAYRKRGEIDKAIQILEKGLDTYSDYASARVILGKCFYDKGATERAREEFMQVLSVDPENMVALKFMGDILLAEDLRSEAAEYYRRLVAIDPTNREVEKILEQIAEEFKVKEIDLDDAASVKKVDQPRELATITLAGIYAAQGYYNKALRIYREILEKEPGNKEAGQMVEKLEGILDAGDRERDEAFEGEIMTISLEDIGDDLVESTTGHGGTDADGESQEGSGEGDDHARKEEISSAIMELEREDVDETGGPAVPERPRIDEEAGEVPGDQDKPSPRDMTHFKDWLKKLRHDRGDEG